MLLGFMLILATSACGTISENNGKLKIYTSFYPVYDFVRRIAKEHADVVNITPVGAEPHDYELTTSDVRGMENADAIFVNGLNLEPWFSSMPSGLKDKSFVISGGIETHEIEGGIDPHVWLNPLNAIRELENIKEVLINLDKDNASEYETNFWNASTLFEALDSKLSSISETFVNKHIVVSHAAFGYLCDRYGLDQIYVDGLSPDDEPTPDDIARIIDAVQKYKITTIFYEELVSSEISDTIARETGAKVEVLNPLEGLSESEMKNDDYVSVMIDDFRKLSVACSE